MILEHFQIAHTPGAIANRTPWTFNGRPAGSIGPDWLALAKDILGPTLNARDLAQVQTLCEAIQAQVAHWQDEPFGLYVAGQTEPVGQIHRGAVPHLGLKAYGVHANGFVRKSDGLHMWVAKRAQNKLTFPGKWDNMVGGGLTAGHTPDEVLAKETDEEAGLSLEQLTDVRFVGQLSYQHAHQNGLRNDCLYLYDLELPEGLEPTPKDGEVERFECWPIERLVEIINTTHDFKYNCNLVITEFLMRHGALDKHPQRAAIQSALDQRFQPA